LKPHKTKTKARTKGIKRYEKILTSKNCDKLTRLWTLDFKPTCNK